MGSVGKSGLNRFLLGSVAQKVVQHAKVPVMLVPGN
jgi:nucleotide-binding universal stress UspA family protein